MRSLPARPALAPFLVLSACLVVLASRSVALGPETGDLAGTVRDGAGMPVAHALVRIQAGPALGQTSTDGAGRYRLPDLPVGDYQVLVSKAAYVGRLFSMVEIENGLETTLDAVLDWGDPSRGALEVLARTAGGTPIPGARVELLQGGVFQTFLQSGAGGSAVFPGLEPGSYSARLLRAGFNTLQTPGIRVRQGRMSVQTATLTPDGRQIGRISGFVRSTSGVAIRGARVRIAEGLSGGETTTGANGLYVLDRLIPGEGYALDVRADGFARQALGGLTVQNQQTTPASVTLVPVLPGTGSLLGSVQDNLGRPLSLATVRLSAGPDTGRTALTGEDGAYLITGLRPTEAVAVTATLAGYSAAGVSGISIREGRTTTAHFILQNQTVPPASIAGTVRETGSGLVLADVLVEILLGPSAGLAGVTDGSGRYQLSGVIPGENYTLRFSKSGFRVVTHTLARLLPGEAGSQAATLTPIEVVTGSIIGLVTGEGVPLRDAKVRLLAGPSAPLEFETGRDGRYRFDNVRAGDGYRIEAKKRGFRRIERANVTLVPGTELRIDFNLLRGRNLGAIQGRVLDFAQRPVEGATIRFVTGPQLPEDLVTDRLGSFLADGLPAGAYSLDVITRSFPNRRVDGIQVTPRVTTPVTIVLTP